MQNRRRIAGEHFIDPIDDFLANVDEDFGNSIVNNEDASFLNGLVMQTQGYLYNDQVFWGGGGSS